MKYEDLPEVDRQRFTKEQYEKWQHSDHNVQITECQHITTLSSPRYIIKTSSTEEWIFDTKIQTPVKLDDILDLLNQYDKIKEKMEGC